MSSGCKQGGGRGSAGQNGTRPGAASPAAEEWERWGWDVWAGAVLPYAILEPSDNETGWSGLYLLPGGDIMANVGLMEADPSQQRESSSMGRGTELLWHTWLLSAWKLPLLNLTSPRKPPKNLYQDKVEPRKPQDIQKSLG